MQPLNVVLLQSDSRVAQSLVSALAKTFGSVHEVQSLDELRTSIAKHRAGVAILDMEAASLSDVQRLSREFPKACIVCTHRLAVERRRCRCLPSVRYSRHPSNCAEECSQGAIRSRIEIAANPTRTPARGVLFI